MIRFQGKNKKNTEMTRIEHQLFNPEASKWSKTLFHGTENVDKGTFILHLTDHFK